MISTETTLDLDLVISRLREKTESTTWMERLEFARLACDALAAGQAVPAALEVARMLARDRAWQVRDRVADALQWIPESELPWFRSQLVDDGNAYVSRSAARSLERRRRLTREETRRKKEEARLAKQVQKLQKQLGDIASERVMRVLRQHSEQLLARVAHDLRTILTYLKPSCHTLMSGDQAVRRRVAPRVRDHLTMLERLVEDTETFVHPVSVQRKSEILRDVIDAAVELVRENVRKCQVDPDRVTVKIDANDGIMFPMARHLVLMALANVLKNAYESFVFGNGRPKKPEITIRVERSHDTVAISVSDNGGGMAEEDLHVVTMFQPGRRDKRKPFSTGFGLPIAARNLTAHGGRIVMQSEENVGTTVTMTLPLNPSDEE